MKFRKKRNYQAKDKPEDAERAATVWVVGVYFDAVSEPVYLSPRPIESGIVFY